MSGGSGSVQIYYRPEDVLLRLADNADSPDDGIRAPIEQIDLTVPLARIRLASTLGSDLRQCVNRVTVEVLNR